MGVPDSLWTANQYASLVPLYGNSWIQAKHYKAWVPFIQVQAKRNQVGPYGLWDQGLDTTSCVSCISPCQGLTYSLQCQRERLKHLSFKHQRRDHWLQAPAFLFSLDVMLLASKKQKGEWRLIGRAHACSQMRQGLVLGLVAILNAAVLCSTE